MRTTCTTCRDPKDRRRKVRLHWENLSGIRIYREVGGRKIYSVRCPSCDTCYEIDGGPDDA